MTDFLKSPAEPDIKTIFDTFKQEIFMKLNVHLIGEIQNFDASKQTATVQIMGKENIAGILVNSPLLVDCPVVIYGGLSGGIRVPINRGDTCIVLCADKDIDNWFSSGGMQPANTKRRHSLSDGIVLVGVHNLLNKITNYDNNSTQINYGNTRVKLNDKILIENEKNSLKILLNNLIEAIENIVTFGSPAVHTISGSSKTALEAVKSQIAEVLS